jgi:hypothetical protein
MIAQIISASFQASTYMNLALDSAERLQITMILGEFKSVLPDLNLLKCPTRVDSIWDRPKS